LLPPVDIIALFGKPQSIPTALREAVDEQDLRPIRISPVLGGYGKAILYMDHLDFCS